MENIALSEACVDTLKSIINLQRKICRIYIKLYGEDDNRTKNSLRLLGKYSMALHLWEEREKANG